MEGLSKKEKGLMDMDNGVVIAGGRGGGRKGTIKGDGRKKYNKKKKKYPIVHPISNENQCKIF